MPYALLVLQLLALAACARPQAEQPVRLDVAVASTPWSPSDRMRLTRAGERRFERTMPDFTGRPPRTTTALDTLPAALVDSAFRLATAAMAGEMARCVDHVADGTAVWLTVTYAARTERRECRGQLNVDEAGPMTAALVRLLGARGGGGW